MDRKTIEEEKAKLLMKFFDYAEAPIQEWIAEYLGVDASEAFEDYQDNSDVIGFKNENDENHYEAYLVTMPPNAGKFVDKHKLDTSEKTRKACSMLFDAVHQVFPAVLSTINKKYVDHAKFLHPIFDDDNMRFCLHRANGAAMELKMGLEARKQILHMLSNETKLEKEALDSINKKLGEANNMITKNNIEILNKEEEICREMNDKFLRGTWLYLALDLTDSKATEESLQRLPTFGLRYQDTDDDTYIEKIKKEYNVNE